MDYSISADVNSLRALRPDLAADWHDEKNAGFRPEDVRPTTVKLFWWVCQNGHEPYDMSPKRRNLGDGCRVCRRILLLTTTSLAATHPQIAKRWDRKKNGKLKPEDVSPGSGLKVWWRCQRNHSFPAVTQSMTKKLSCRECTGRLVTEKNCLRATHPWLVEEFDFARNGEITPDNIRASSDKRLSWICALGHNWPAEVRARADGSRCTVCQNKSVWIGFNDMSTTRPDMVLDWADEADEDLRPPDVLAGTNNKNWWKCSAHGPWPASGQQKSKGAGCRECYAERIAREREAVRAARAAMPSS